MMKSTHWVGVFAIGICSAAALSGCSGDPAPTNQPMGTAGTPATGGASTGGATGIQLTGPAAYTQLTGADATASATPAPSAWVGKGCNACHGNNGEGTSMIGPEVRHTPTTYAQWVVRNGRPPFIMAQFPEVPAAMKTDVSAADLTSILTWLQGQPKPTTPEGLYKDFCGNCHGPKMGTGGSAPISIIGKKMTEVTMKVRGGEGTDPSMRSAYMPIIDAAALSDTELGLIMTFIGATP
jgi:mono/diheme cytochrome c family protein